MELTHRIDRIPLITPPQPTVSVVIPFHNRISATRRAVESVVEQSYASGEIIVVDDASDDDVSMLVDFLLSVPGAVYIRQPTNTGPAGARNAGIERATCDYIAFLDSDDTWEPNKLEVQVQRMLTRRWSFSHTSYYRHDSMTGKTRRVNSGRHRYVFPKPAFHCLIATPSVVVDRRLLSDLRFRPDLRVGEDTLLWLQLSRRTVLHGIDNALVHVFVGRLTAAHDSALQAEALRMLGRDGLADHRLLRGIHAAYRMGRESARLAGRYRRSLAARARERDDAYASGEA